MRPKHVDFDEISFMPVGSHTSLREVGWAISEDHFDKSYISSNIAQPTMLEHCIEETSVHADI